MSETTPCPKYPPADRWQTVIDAESVHGSDRAVLFVLAFHADQSTLVAWPAVPTLAREAGVSEDTARRSLRALESLGAITVLNRTAGGVGHTNRYRVNLDTAASWASVRSKKPPQNATLKPPHSATVSGSNPRTLRPEPPQVASQTPARCGGNRGIEQSNEQIDLIDTSITDRKITDDRFVEFWTQYPNRKAKKAAERVWQKLKPDDDLFADIMDGLQQWLASPDWEKDGGKYIPHPASWLNGRRWEDEIGVQFKQERHYAPAYDY